MLAKLLPQLLPGLLISGRAYNILNAMSSFAAASLCIVSATG